MGRSSGGGGRSSSGGSAGDALRSAFTASNITAQDVRGLPPPDSTAEAREFLESMPERHRAYTERTGASRIPALRADPSEINDLFPPGSAGRDRALQTARSKGVQGMNDFEILVRGLEAVRLPQVNEFTNLSPVLRGTDSQGNVIIGS